MPTRRTTAANRGSASHRIPGLVDLEQGRVRCKSSSSRRPLEAGQRLLTVADQVRAVAPGRMAARIDARPVPRDARAPPARRPPRPSRTRPPSSPARRPVPRPRRRRAHGPSASPRRPRDIRRAVCARRRPRTAAADRPAPRSRWPRRRAGPRRAAPPEAGNCPSITLDSRLPGSTTSARSTRATASSGLPMAMKKSAIGWN